MQGKMQIPVLFPLAAVGHRHAKIELRGAYLGIIMEPAKCRMQSFYLYWTFGI